MKNNTTMNEADQQDFKNLVDLMAVYSEASNQLGELESSVNGEMLELVDEHKEAYAKLQKTLTDAEAALELITLKHPEWFGEKKRSIKTPYGTVKFHQSTKLVVPNEEATLLLIEREAKDNPQFKRNDFIRTQEVLNIEALEKLDDAVLKKLRVNREKNDNFSVAPAKVDMGKAVKETAVKEVAA